MLSPYAVLCLRPTAGSGSLPARRVRLGVAVAATDGAGEAPRLLACLLAARVVRLVDMVGAIKVGAGGNRGKLGLGGFN